jgi:nitrogen-specific signal transduction histidine kinase
MGLGLSLCRTVVEQHGGVLDFAQTSRVVRYSLHLPVVANSGAGR